MIIRALRSLGALEGGGDALGLACEIENVIYYIAKHARSVLATDLYAEDGVGEWAARRIQVADVLAREPFPYPKERLKARSMDMRKIDAPDESYDIVWSSCALEHVDTTAELAGTLGEAARVLRPGGVHVLTTEWKLAGGFSYFPNCFVFDRPLLERTLRDLPLEHVGPIDLRLTDHPLNTPVWRGLDGIRENMSHIVLFQKGVMHTSLSLAFRKVARPGRPLDFIEGDPGQVEWLGERLERWKRELATPQRRIGLALDGTVGSAVASARLAFRRGREAAKGCRDSAHRRIKAVRSSDWPRALPS